MLGGGVGWIIVLLPSPPSSFYTTFLCRVVPVYEELLIYFSRHPLFIYDQSS